MIGNMEQELQIRMGGRSRQKVSGDCKNHVNGSHGPKLVLINLITRRCYSVRLFVAYLTLGLCLLVHPFKNAFQVIFKEPAFT